MVSVMHAFAGTRMAGPADRFVLKFDTMNASHMFLKGSRLFILYDDDQRLVLDAVAADSDISLGVVSGVRVEEMLAWELTRDQLRKLAAAKKIEIMVSGNERGREIKPKDRKGWQTLLDITEAQPVK
jgi:hypothetical protein